MGQVIVGGNATQLCHLREGEGEGGGREGRRAEGSTGGRTRRRGGRKGRRELEVRVAMKVSSPGKHHSSCHT